MPHAKIIPTKKKWLRKRQPPTDAQWLYTRKQAAERIGISIDTIKRLERQGRLTPIRLTHQRGSVRLRATEVRRPACPLSASSGHHGHKRNT